MQSPIDPSSAAFQSVDARVPARGRDLFSWPRVAVALVLLALFAYAFYRPIYSMNPFYVGLGGPYWYVEATDDIFLGWSVALLCLAGMGSVIVWPRWFTIVFALLSLLVWEGVGLGYMPYVFDK